MPSSLGVVAFLTIWPGLLLLNLRGWQNGLAECLVLSVGCLREEGACLLLAAGVGKEGGGKKPQVCAPPSEGSCLPVFSIPFARQLVLLCFSLFSCVGDQTQEEQARQALSHTELHLQSRLVLEFLVIFLRLSCNRKPGPSYRGNTEKCCFLL